MSIIEAIFLGLVQGLTEFIPVSSSGHLVLFHEIFGATEHELTFDVALHFGTLLALVFYFYNDIILLAKGLVGKNEYSRLAKWLAVATVPAVIAGVLLESAAESVFRSTRLVAFNLIAVALLMLFAEHYAKRFKHKTELKEVTGRQSLIIGLSQAAAIVPGVSRSGGTITAGLLMGLDRVAATRFSFLLGIPIMIGAILKVLFSEETLARLQGDKDIFAVGIIAAFISGMIAIKFLLKFLSKHTLAVFAYYRIIIGLLVLVIPML